MALDCYQNLKKIGKSLPHSIMNYILKINVKLLGLVKIVQLIGNHLLFCHFLDINGIFMQETFKMKNPIFVLLSSMGHKSGILNKIYDKLGVYEWMAPAPFEHYCVFCAKYVDYSWWKEYK